ncbi:MAG: cobalamin-dependent protein [Cellulomonas sp.]
MVDDRLPLRDAAAELDVHYQTAYKWVTSGALPATMVRGRYVIDRADLAEFTTRRDAPVEPRVRTAARRPERLDRAADRLHTALTAGDEPAKRRIAVSLIERGVPFAAVIQDVISPALRRIGAAWVAGDSTIWVEHRASAIVERLLGHLQRETRGRRRGTVVSAAMSGDLHNLPSAMAAAALREDNWAVEHLGCDVPGEELVDFCAKHDVDLVVITVTTAGVAASAERTAQVLRATGIPTLVGGASRTLDDLLVEARASVRAGSRSLSAVRPAQRPLPSTSAHGGTTERE